MEKLLWISQLAPYDKVDHAGGKIHNYLVKFFKRAGYFDLFLISFAKDNEKEKLDMDQYGIANDIAILSTSSSAKLLRKCVSAVGFSRKISGEGPLWQISILKKKVKKYRREKGEPDYVILQWTMMVNQIKWLKKMFPKSRFIAIEEDVTYLKVSRYVQAASGFRERIRRIHYNLYKATELNSLDLADIVVLNNQKDRDLVVRDGIHIEKTFVSSPYFQNMKDVIRNNISNDILFYGAMNRPENADAAIWFLDNVWYYVKERIPDARFVILGGKPSKDIQDRAREDIVVTGFVDDIKPYFAHSLCCIAPLNMGAGVKIKVLEGLSSGIPVLTNSIGIEGIPAVHSHDFFFCETPEDYIETIIRLAENPGVGKIIEENARSFIKKNYNCEASAKELIKRIREL